LSPAARARSTTGANRPRLSSIEQLMLRREKLSDAAPNTAISWTPEAVACSSPFRFGTRTG
jgi:hypothetical protein